MDTITIYRDEGPDLRFAGERVGCVISKKHPSQKHWTELQLYRTQTGRFVAVEIGQTAVKGQKMRVRAEIFDTEREVVSFFEHGWLAKELYRQAGIDAAIEVA